MKYSYEECMEISMREFNRRLMNERKEQHCIPLTMPDKIFISMEKELDRANRRIKNKWLKKAKLKP